MERNNSQRPSLLRPSLLLFFLMAIGSFMRMAAQETMELVDANGNTLLYYCENDTSAAFFTGIKSYAQDETQAGRIIIADEVSDSQGNVHEVRYICYSGSISNRYNLVSVVFGNNIICVGGQNGNINDAFYNCQKLESVTLNAKLETIGPYAFENCYALKTVNFEDATSLRVLKDYCFRNCPLEAITIASNLESYGRYAFYGCNSVRTITYNGTNIPNNFFNNRSCLETINIGKNVKSIGEYAFNSNSGLTVLNFDPEVSDLVIGKNAFYNCDRIKTVILPAGVVTLGDAVFDNCDSLRSFTFAEGSPISAIPYNTFAGCVSLEEIALPDAVETLGVGTFYHCYSLKAISFGTSLIELNNDYWMFNGCQLEKMVLPGTTYPFLSDYGLPSSIILYVHPDLVETYKTSNYTKNYRIVAIGSTTEYNITTTAGGQLAAKIPAEVAGNVLSLTINGPINGTDINQIHELMPNIEVLNLKNAQIVEGGEEYYRYSISYNSNKPYKETGYHYATENDVIGQYMFYNMPFLKQLSLPSGASVIGDNAVASNAKLTQVDIPVTVTAIGKYAFSYTGIKTLAIPANVTRIEDGTYRNCESLTTATMPDSITFIGNEAFYNCYNLESVNIPTQVESIGNDAFCNNNKLASPIVIPATCKSIGDYAFDDNYLIPSVTLNEGLESIGSYAFNNCQKTEEITLPQSLVSLGAYAFRSCQALKQLTFPVNIKQVPDGVLYQCNSLDSVVLADGTTQIGNSAFYYCPKLTLVENLNQNTLTSIGSSAFGCTALTSVTLPNTITSMGTYVFYGCSQLESANIPTGVSTVPDYTFQGCAKLTNVTMHDSITRIGESAFDGCKLLPTIYLSDEITVIANYAFRNTYAMNIDLTIPETVTTLGFQAFYGSGITSLTITKPISNFDSDVFRNCTNLDSVSLPHNMTKIPNYTFYGTTALNTIILPETLQEIGSYAFYGSGLTEITLPKSLLTIGTYAFYGTQLAKLEVPKNVTSVGSMFAANCMQLKEAQLGRKQDYATNSYFDYFAGCDSLELLRVHAGTPPTISTSSVWIWNTWKPYTGYRTNCVLEVPEGQVDIYQATDIWKEFREIRAFESGEMLNDADYAALKDLYSNLNGASWLKPWDISKQNHSNGKWQGVSTEVDPENDDLFYITGINLSGQGLVGQMPKSVFNLPKLKSLNLSHNVIEAKIDTLIDSENTVMERLNMEGNHLKGDLYPFVSKLPNLTNLNLRFNWLTKISQAIPHDKLSNDALWKGYQFIDYETKLVSVPEELMDDVVINLTLGEPVSLGSNISFQTYRHNYGDYNYTFSNMSRLYKSGDGLSTSYSEIAKNNETLWDISSSNPFQAPKGELIAYTYGYQNYYYDSHDYITFIFRIDWKDGDVNVDQTVDVADLQNVIYYALNDNKPRNQVFNYTTADANSDNKINVSDIIGSVNYILNYEEPEIAPARMFNRVEADCRNFISKNGSTVTLTSADEVAALQLTISGVQQDQLQIAQGLRSRFTVSMRDVDGGVRLVAYSPIGNTLAPGENILINGLPADAVISDVRLVDGNAVHLSVSFDSTTSIDELSSDYPCIEAAPLYDLSGRPVGKWDTLPAGIYIVKMNGKQFKVRK